VNTSFVWRFLVRTVLFVLVDAEVRPIFAKSQSLFAKRRQQRPPDDPLPPLLPPSPPSRPWPGSGRRRLPAPAVTRPRPSPPRAHYHLTRVLRCSLPLPSCHQPPPSRRAVLELGLSAASACGILTRPYAPPTHSRHIYLGQGRCANERRRQLSRLRDLAVQSHGGVLRCRKGDAHGCSQISLVRRPPCSRRLVEIVKKGAPPTAKGVCHTSAIPSAFSAIAGVSEGSETEVGVRRSRGGRLTTAQAPASSGIEQAAPRLSVCAGMEHWKAPDPGNLEGVSDGRYTPAPATKRPHSAGCQQRTRVNLR